MVITGAIIFGLFLNYFTGGLEFSSLLCVFAGFFMIMPSLLTFTLKDIINIKNNKKILLLNILMNFIVNPLIARIIGSILLHDFGLTVILIMLSILSGGGLVFAWIKKSNADPKAGFQMFMINLLIFTILFFIATPWITSIATQTTSNLVCSTPVVGCFSTGTKISPISAIIVLVIFPFIVSRLISLSTKLKTFAQKYVSYASHIGTFIIIVYIFSLKQMHTIFETDIMLLTKTFLATLLFYILVFGINTFILKKREISTKENIAKFWLTTTRFITLGLVLSFMYTQYFSTSIMLIFISAYFIQIILSTVITKHVRLEK